MKHPKHIQKIIDKPSCLSEIRKQIKESNKRIQEIQEDGERRLRRCFGI